MKAHRWIIGFACLVFPGTVPGWAQGSLAFEEPKDGAVYRAGAEVPFRLRAEAAGDVFLAAEIRTNGTFLASAGFCCWLCPCAHPLPGMTTILQIPGPHVADSPGILPWQGWRFSTPGKYIVEAVAIGENGMVVAAPPITLRVEAINLKLGIELDPDGGVRLALPEGSLFPERLAVELSIDLVHWERLGDFEPGNVAAFFHDQANTHAATPRYYRAVAVR